MRKLLIVVLSCLMFIFAGNNTVYAKKEYSNDSSEIKELDHLVESLRGFGKSGKLDSLEILSYRVFDKLDESVYQNKEEIKAEVYNILANHGKYTKGNTYRIQNRKRALSLFKETNNKDKYAYSILFLSRDFFEIKQIDSALYYLNKAEQYLSNDTLSVNLARCFTMRGNIKNQTGNCQGGIEDHLKALNIIKNQEQTEQTSFQLAVITSNISGCYIQLEDFNNSLKFALKALEYSDTKDFPIERKASTLTNLAVSYFRMGLFDKARLIYKDILSRKESITNVNILICAYSNLAFITDSIPEAMRYINESESMSEEYNSDYYRAEIYNVKSLLLTKDEKYTQAEQYARKAIKENWKNNDTIGVVKNQAQLTHLMYLVEDYDKVVKLGSEFLPRAKINGCWYDAQSICKVMIEAALYSEDADLLYDIYIEEKEVQDTIAKINNEKIFAELNTKYETEKKEQQIELLEVTTQNQQLSIEKAEQERNMILAGISLLFLMTVPVGFYTRQRSKNKVLEARINSENKECTRIAKDLHDSVSGSLTTIRYLLETGTDSDCLIENIESVSNEVRGISHKLNMSALASQSFKQAVSDSLMLSHFPKDIDLSINFPEGFEIKAYEKKMNLIRILQELVNNSLKHSEASKIDICFKAERKKTWLTFNDNGLGCKLDEVKKGNGLSNIQDRVKMLSGEVKFDSQPGQGFYCQIEI